MILEGIYVQIYLYQIMYSCLIALCMYVCMYVCIVSLIWGLYSFINYVKLAVMRLPRMDV